MQVSELAKELNTTSKAILDRLRALKLKAKDSSQELNSVVLSVLRNDFSKNPPPPAPKEEPILEKIVKAKSVKAAKPKIEKTGKPEKAVKAPKAEKPKAGKTTEKAPKATAKTTKAKSKTVEKEQPAVAPQEPEAVKPAVVKPEISVESKPEVKVEIKPKSKLTLSAEPFVAVKPLAKKKRKGPSDSSGHGAIEIPFSTSLEAAERILPQPGVVETEKPKVSLRDLELEPPVAVKDLAVKMQQKPSALLKKLMEMGLFAHINQYLDEEVLRKLALEFGFNVTKIKTREEKLIESHQTVVDDPSLLKPRAPVVTLMGHVDHGKTTLLDKLRKSRVVDTEHGAITQHIGAYSVQTPKGRITFLDTPGHEAFTAMRARGTTITDLVILVVAADEGFMPQTDEALDHALAANVPVVVAVTKIDKRNADIERVKKQLMERNLTPEDWGGKTIVLGVSAVTGEGIDALLEMMLLEAELLELKANYDRRASGAVVEAHLSPGRGVVATLIVQNGTLRDGDVVIAGSAFGKVKAMFDDYQGSLKFAEPAMPVEILGLDGVPDAGENFYVVESEKEAKEISLRRKEYLKTQKLQASQKITLEDLYTQIQEGKIKELNVIIKADVQGSLEALKDSLLKIPSDQIKLKFIHTGVGEINSSDVILATASNAIIMGFNVGVDPRAKEELEKQKVDVRQYRIIYDAVNDIMQALEGLLEPKTKKKFLGRVDIRNVFKLSKSGAVAGCYVTKGKVQRKSHIDIVRNGDIVFSGNIGSLKRFKDDVREVGEGFECGITIDGYTDYQVGDVIEVFELEKIARKL